MTNLRKTVALATIVIAACAVAQSVRTELQASLTGIGKGKAKWKVSDRGGERQAELEVEGERLPANMPLAITIGSNAPFAVTTNSFGAYNLSKRYVTKSRPTISAGDSVTVTDADSNIIQSGVMQPR